VTQLILGVQEIATTAARHTETHGLVAQMGHRKTCAKSKICERNEQAVKMSGKAK